MATKKKAEVRIPSLEKQIVQLRLIGTDILVTKRGGDNLTRQLEINMNIDPDTGLPLVAKGGKRVKPQRNPFQEYRDARYIINEDDTLDGFPAYAIKNALIDTAYTFAPVDRTMVRGAVYVMPAFLDKYVPIECSIMPPPMRKDPERIGASGGTDVRYRPEYRDWSIPIDVEFDPNLISLNNLMNLFQIAGFSVGIGEHRPQKGGGTWGRFDVMFEEEWQKLQKSGKKTAVKGKRVAVTKKTSKSSRKAA